MEEDDSISAILTIGGIILVVVSTIAGIFNLWGDVLAYVFVFYFMWLISTILLGSFNSDWSKKKAGIIGLIIAISITLGVYLDFN